VGLPTDGMWSQNLVVPSDEPGTLTAKAIGVKNPYDSGIPKAMKSSKSTQDQGSIPSIFPSDRKINNLFGETCSAIPIVTGKLQTRAPLHAIDLTQELLLEKGEYTIFC
jgi:hypothetical protein